MYNEMNLKFIWHRLHRAHRKAMDAALIEAGCADVSNPMLLSVLKCSNKTDACDQQTLAKRLNTSPATIAVSLKSLEKSGHITRQRTEGDARRNLVTLTPKGSTAVSACHRCFQLVDERMLSGFTPEETALLTSFVERMLANIQPRPTGNAPDNTLTEEDTPTCCN